MATIKGPRTIQRKPGETDSSFRLRVKAFLAGLAIPDPVIDDELLARDLGTAIVQEELGGQPLRVLLAGQIRDVRPQRGTNLLVITLENADFDVEGVEDALIQGKDVVRLVVGGRWPKPQRSGI